eukprot:Hpha_TRINITY_DN15580_c0_g2::TRINITY_DN15580_c0_g2_i2::g.105948::m.105948
MRTGDDAATEEEGLAMARRNLQQSGAAPGWGDGFSSLSALETEATQSSSVKVGSLSAAKIWKLSFSDSSTLMPVIRCERKETGYTQTRWDSIEASTEKSGAWCGRRKASWKMSKGKWGGKEVHEDSYFACFRLAGSRLAFLVVHSSQRVKGLSSRVETLYRFIGHSKPSGGHTVRLLITSKVVTPRGNTPEKVLKVAEPRLRSEHDAFLSTFTRRAQDHLLSRAGRRGVLSHSSRHRSVTARKQSVLRAKEKAVRRFGSVLGSTGLYARSVSRSYSRSVSTKWGTVRVKGKGRIVGGVHEQRLEDYLRSEKSSEDLSRSSHNEDSIFRAFPDPVADLQLLSSTSRRSSTLTRTVSNPGTMTVRPTYSDSHLRRPSVLPAGGCLDDLPQWGQIGAHTLREQGVARLKTVDDYHEELLHLRREIERAPRAKVLREGLTLFQVERLHKVTAAQPVHPRGGRPVVLEEVLRILKLLTLHGDPGSTSRLAGFCTNIGAVDTILTACEVNDNIGQAVASEFTTMVDYIAATRECRQSRCETADERRLLSNFGIDPKATDGSGELVGVFKATLVAPYSAAGTLFVTRGYICFLASHAEGGKVMVSSNDVTTIEGRGGFWRNVVSVHCENRYAGPYDVNQEKVVLRFRFMRSGKAEVALRSVVPSRPIRFREVGK